MSAMTEKITFGILTVSDRCSAGQAEDESGANLHRIITAGFFDHQAVVLHRMCVPDEMDQIVAILQDWSDINGVDVILTTGGTGFSPRDITPEATKRVIERYAPGLTIAMMKSSLDITPYAMLSRSVCGIRHSTLIVNLPGSTKGAKECFDSIAMSIPHAVALLRNRQLSVEAIHTKIPLKDSASKQPHHRHNHQHGKDESKVDVSRVARRARESPYPMVHVSHAQDIVLEHAKLLDMQEVSLRDALGRILACDIHAKDPLPPFRASIKDGYAALASDGAGPRTVVGSSVAGNKPEEQTCLLPGQCTRINTGAPVPAGADCVVQVEDTKLLKEDNDGRTELEVDILTLPVVGQDIRHQGSDIEAGQLVLKEGSHLGPSELGLLATVGITNVPVYQLPMVAILSTGNELQDPSLPLVTGLIRDSNKTTLMALITEHGFPAVDMGIAKDEPKFILSKLRNALSCADVVVTTGSVSMGDRDILKNVLTADLGGTVHFARVLMKPGKPTAFITLEYEGKMKLVLGLPGNPVSATVTSHLYVLPLLRKMSGHRSPLGTIITVTIEEEIYLDPRPEYHRVIITWVPQNPVPIARSTGNQISSRLLSLSSANALLILPPRTASQTTLFAGSQVDAMIISRI